MSFLNNNTFGSLSSAPDGSIIENIFNYVTDCLGNFNANTEENENAITHRFCLHLAFNKPPEYPYFFQHQNLEDEKENTSTDFAAFSTLAYAWQNIISNNSAMALIKFEAKRLSTNLPKSREKEYVIGEYKGGKRTSNSGGIERFKNERHGKDVKAAGIIGYLQSDSFSSWNTKINGWIQQEIANPSDKTLSWNKEDTLSLIKSDIRIISFKSKAKRLSGDSIYLRHLWVNFT